MVRLIFILGLIVNLVGCVNTSLSADVDPSADLSTLNSFFVIRQPKDERGIERLIAEELEKLGRGVGYGEELQARNTVDAVITYQDRWMWDITMYMIELRIQVREPATDYIIASGEVYRSSLARKSPEEMVQSVIREIFGEK